MKNYECTNCSWKGDITELTRVPQHRFAGLCPVCEDKVIEAHIVFADIGQEDKGTTSETITPKVIVSPSKEVPESPPKPKPKKKSFFGRRKRGKK